VNDGETDRARLAIMLWSAGTATERKAKPVWQWLPAADDLLKRSYTMGSPMSAENPDVVYLDPTPFSVVRWKEWISRQSPELQALYREALA
jgi:hypothetical protein